MYFNINAQTVKWKNFNDMHLKNIISGNYVIFENLKVVGEI